MKKTLQLLFISVFSLSSVLAQDDMGDFVPGSEVMTSEYFGDICSNIENEAEKMVCSNDQIKDFVSSLATPSLVEKVGKKMSVSVYFDLSSSGKVENISIKKSSGNEVLDNIVLEHFNKMPNWQPMTIDGVALGSPNMSLTYKFKPKLKK